MDITGNLLIAPPSVKGNFWYKTVIAVTEHHENGSVGLVLNKRSQMTVNEFASQLNIHMDVPGFIYLGGPINVKSLSFLHSPEWSCDNTMLINNYFSLSSSESILPRLALGDHPKQWRLFLGMCGWSPNQLLSEIKGIPPFEHNVSWCTAHSDPALVFDYDSKDQWIQALDKSALEFSRSIFS